MKIKLCLIVIYKIKYLFLCILSGYNRQDKINIYKKYFTLGMYYYQTYIF